MVVTRRRVGQWAVNVLAYLAALAVFLLVVFLATGAWGQAGTAGDPRHHLTACIGLEYGNSEAENYNWDRIDKFLCAIQAEDICAEIAACATCPLGCLTTTSTSSTTTTATTTSSTTTTCVPGDVECDPDTDTCCPHEPGGEPAVCARGVVDPPSYECLIGCPANQPCTCPAPADPFDLQPEDACAACNGFPCGVATFPPDDSERRCLCGS